MSSLQKIDKIKFEKIFGMEIGYVCNFNNKTFADFILESTGIDIYTPEYEQYGTSKANRLRLFWIKESDYLVGKLLLDLLEYSKIQAFLDNTFDTGFNEELYRNCLTIAESLKSNTPVDKIDDLKPLSDAKSFQLLIDSIKECIKNNQPEQGLDRLHTFTVKYLRELCSRHHVNYDKNTTLNALMGGYIKAIRNKGLIESVMTERILKSSISILEAFNGVRNDQSLAHDNEILNYQESVLIFNNVTSSIKFLQRIEEEISTSPKSH
jgi:hypothetical protein